jgi:hypothetical protein
VNAGTPPNAMEQNKMTWLGSAANSQHVLRTLKPK